MDGTVPGVRFDEHGVCNHCRIHDHLERAFPIGDEGARILQGVATKVREGGKGRIRTGDYGDGAQVFKKDSIDPAYVTVLSERTRKEVRGQAIGELG